MNRIESPGIRLKVMAYLTLFVAFVVGMLWVGQVVFLNEIYTYFKSRQAADAATAVIRRLKEGPRTVEEIALTHEVNLSILNQEGKVVYRGEGAGFGYLRNMPDWEIQELAEKAPADGTALVEVTKGWDERMDWRFSDHRDSNQKIMYYIRRFQKAASAVLEQEKSDGNQSEESETDEWVLILAAQLTPVDATVSVLRAQLIIITVLIGLGANLLAYLISSRVTRPIIDTNTAAKALSHGDFAPPKRRGYREIVELNQTLEQASRNLKQVERLQRELIANISHDLRTPLTMIGGYAEVMRDIPGEMQPENMQVIIDETRRLTALVNNLLDLSRIQSGAVKMSVSPFNITALLRMMAHRYTLMMEREGYQVLLEAEEAYQVMGEYVRIEQVVNNLISNALTYTGEDKTVRVIQARRGDRVRIEIQDSGAGIPPEEIPLIWQRYYRSGGTHRRSVQGAGLGLSIVSSILQGHQAPYGVESTLGKGSVFWFELNLADGPSAEAPELSACHDTTDMPKEEHIRKGNHA